MKRYSILPVILFAILLSFAQARTWTSATDGETREGDYLRMESDGQTVVIKKANGKLVRIQKDQLSKEDQNYLDSLNKGQSRGSFEDEDDDSEPSTTFEKKATLDMSHCYALLIGIDKYNDSENNLQYCGADMKLLAETLEKVGFPKEQIHLMISDAQVANQPTKANIMRVLENLTKIMDENSTLFVAFGGHGLTDKLTGDTYLCPSDMDWTTKSTLILRDDVFKMIDQCKATRKVFLVDACRNLQTIERAIGARGITDPLGGNQYGFVLLSSCGKEEFAREGSVLGHGIFTYYLSEGLKGKAANQDGEITIMALFNYASRETKNYVFENFNHAVQQPTMSLGGEMPDFLLAKVKGNPEAEELYQKAEMYATADHGHGEQDWDKAIQFYRQAADLGHSRAMIELGNCFSKGYGVHKNYEEALKWYQKAAKANEPGAYLNIGDCYLFGKGVTSNVEEAKRWYDKAFATLSTQKENGDPITQFDLGLCYWYGHGTTKDTEEGVKWFLKAAEQGYVRAQAVLAASYALGIGVPENQIESAKWARKAAEQGDAGTQFTLGLSYKLGLGVSQDHVEAVKWFRKAAVQEEAQAQFAIGKCYLTGEGVKQDYDTGSEWIRKAADQGYADAQCLLGECYQLTKYKTEAVKWLRKAAEQENARAQFLLGVCYSKGEGVEQDYDEAVTWLRKAVEQGYADAQLKLGWCYYEGTGVQKDFTKTIELFHKAAEQGLAMAQFALGVCYQAGIGTPQDDVEAVKWFRKGAEQENVLAQNRLAQCYRYGTGVPQDKEEAVKWYRKAAEQGNDEAKEALKQLEKD